MEKQESGPSSARFSNFPFNFVALNNPGEQHVPKNFKDSLLGYGRHLSHHIEQKIQSTTVKNWKLFPSFYNSLHLRFLPAHFLNNLDKKIVSLAALFISSQTQEVTRTRLQSPSFPLFFKHSNALSVLLLLFAVLIETYLQTLEPMSGLYLD